MNDWQHYVDHDLIGSGKVNRAAIVGLDGGIVAASEGYTLSREEQLSLIEGFKDLARVQANGIRLAGRKFFVIQDDPSSIYAKKHADGATVVKTFRCIIVAEYDAPIQMTESVAIVESFADDLRKAGD
ncbi:hypothetical protein E1267_24940 [Nonomuraea longispora]|uniref:Profilin n=1 Tax=Nonomuraea longispora TaxID=1848320 RepID=A0A4R4N755_9ACTN|nr:profilin [Nonomuraea longispora]TDC03854.1 hypothetical protein E1267_24940 [Nonomuraea longispora]